jgi:hypothetical protein
MSLSTLNAYKHLDIQVHTEALKIIEEFLNVVCKQGRAHEKKKTFKYMEIIEE